MATGKMIIISGPSGSGKTTLHKMMLASMKKLVRSVSVTTRPPRAGEVPGRDYVFVTQRMFAYKQRAGHFLESEKVFDYYYGTPRKQVLELLKAGKHVLLCIDVKGARTALKKFPQAITVFIKTKSIEVLEERLAQRASESVVVRAQRLKRAQAELAQARYYRHVVVNDDLQEAFTQIKHIIDEALAQSSV